LHFPAQLYLRCGNPTERSPDFTGQTRCRPDGPPTMATADQLAGLESTLNGVQTMKKIHALTLASTLAFGAPLAIAQQGPYVGGSLAKPSWADPVNGIDGSSSGTGLKVYGGWAFTPNFALEAGAANLGSQSVGANDAKARGYFLDGVGTLPLNADWSVLGRIGLADMKTVTTLGSDRGTALKTGLGVQYQLNKSVALRGEWERYRLSAFGEHPNADQVSFGVKVGF
jgi:OmpA-OmpF porin, OOP family